MFWLSYECFSILCNAFLLKSAISSHNSCEMSVFSFYTFFVFLYQFFKKVWVELSRESATMLWQKMWSRVSHEFGANFESVKIARSGQLHLHLVISFELFWFIVIYIKNESWKYLVFTLIQQYIPPCHEINFFIYNQNNVFYIFFSIFQWYHGRHLFSDHPTFKR